jgi:hypothetical protein
VPPVGRGFFFYQKSDFSALWSRWPHEFPDRIEHDLELSIVSFFKRFQLARQVLVSCD